jgi:HSP20 family molecular chaperone IbpA
MLTRSTLLPSLFTAPRFGSGALDLWDPTFGMDWGWDNSFTQMPSHIEQTDTAVNVDLSVPGFKDNEVQVTVDGNLLRINAEHRDRQEQDEKDPSGRVVGHSKRWRSENVSESFRLPSGLNTEGLTKQIDNGVLRISIPKLAITDRPHQQQGQQQLQHRHRYTSLAWPPHVTQTESHDRNSIIYTIALPDVRKEDLRINVENSKLYLTLTEHDDGHAFDTCSRCNRDPESKKEWKECTRFSERSSVVRLPFGTTADDLTAKFEHDALIVTVNHRGRSHYIPIQ